MDSVQGPMTGRVLARRRFLTTGATMLGGAVLLDACGSSGSGANPAPSKHPPIGKEPGSLSILEWGGYEAAGTKAQTNGLEAGKDYTAKFGTSGITYTYITNDDQALEKATSAGPFDLLHPCHENLPDYVSRGLVQPFDTSLLPSFKQLNPYLVKQGQINGKQYMIPWDWGYGSLTYRTDHVSASDASGWELAWNKKYSGKISLWSGASTNFEIAALKLGFPKMDNLTHGPDLGSEGDAAGAETAEQAVLGQRVRPDAAGRQVRNSLDRLFLAGHPGVDEGRRECRSVS